MASDPKKRKLNPPPTRTRTRRASSPPCTLKVVASKSEAPIPQTNIVNLRLQEAKNYAIAQAQQDGATGNFRIVDSQFGNFLIPAIPTREDLLEKHNPIS